jgi:diaminopimelate decarboxylase
VRVPWQKSRTDLGLQFPDLDLGGGLGIRYLPEDTPPTYEEYAQGRHWHRRRPNARV